MLALTASLLVCGGPPVTIEILKNPISIGEDVEVVFTVESMGPVPEATFGGLEEISRGTSKQVQIVNGKTSGRSTLRVRVRARRPGSYVIECSGRRAVLMVDNKRVTRTMRTDPKSPYAGEIFQILGELPKATPGLVRVDAGWMATAAGRYRVGDADLVVRPLPAGGPAKSPVHNVGQFTLEARIDHTNGPKLIVTVRGRGNLTMLSTPTVHWPDVWAPERGSPEHTDFRAPSPLKAGARTYVWPLLAAAGVPKPFRVELPYFDPATERYEVASATLL